VQVQVTKWGNNLGIRVPKDMATQLGLVDGARVDVELDGSRLVISTAKQVYQLEELLRGMTPEAMHEAFDWGPDVGRENVP
jgi:antitoxin MazE